MQCDEFAHTFRQDVVRHLILGNAMRSLTLQKGDVITAVNGQLLSDPSVLYSLMGKLTSQKNIDVTIERNGQVQVIQLQL